MEIAVDIDGTLFEDMPSDKIYEALPIQKAIEWTNKMYDEGHIITIYTARGMKRLKGQSHLIPELYYEKTTQQLKSAGVKYHHLVFGKLAYDLLIDDKTKTMEQILKQ